MPRSPRAISPPATFRTPTHSRRPRDADFKERKVMGSTHHGSEHGAAAVAATVLRSTVTIRERASQLLQRARAGQSRWFNVDDGAIDAAAAEVTRITKQRFHRGHVPIHSRWRHF